MKTITHQERESARITYWNKNTGWSCTFQRTDTITNIKDRNFGKISRMKLHTFHNKKIREGLKPEKSFADIRNNETLSMLKSSESIPKPSLYNSLNSSGEYISNRDSSKSAIRNDFNDQIKNNNNSQLDHKDNNNTSNKQVFNKNFLEKSKNNIKDTMNIFEYIKSKITSNTPNSILIKGISYRQVENGWIPNTESTSITLSDILKKGKRAEIGTITERNGVKWKKVSERPSKWVVVSEGKQSKQEDQSKQKGTKKEDQKKQKTYSTEKLKSQCRLRSKIILK